MSEDLHLRNFQDLTLISLGDLLLKDLLRAVGSLALGWVSEKWVKSEWRLKFRGGTGMEGWVSLWWRAVALGHQCSPAQNSVTPVPSQGTLGEILWWAATRSVSWMEWKSHSMSWARAGPGLYPSSETPLSLSLGFSQSCSVSLLLPLQ